MEKIVIYRAFDGTDFEDATECREYEFAENTKDCRYSLLDNHFQPLDLSLPGSYDSCFYIFVPDENAMEDLYDNWDDDLIGTYCPSCISYGAPTGLYAYNSDSEEWFHVGEKIAELQDLADHAMKAINGV